MTRRLVRRTTFLIAAVAAASLVSIAATPAGAATVPAKWGKTFCSSLETWGEEIQSGAEELEETTSGPSITPSQGKTLLVGFLGDAGGLTSDFGDNVRGAGAPKVANGAAIQSAVLEGIAGVEALLTSLTSQANQLPTTDAATFKSAAAPLQAQLETVSAPFEDAMDTVASLEKKNELQKAMKKVKACKFLFR